MPTYFKFCTDREGENPYLQTPRCQSIPVNANSGSSTPSAELPLGPNLLINFVNCDPTPRANTGQIEHKNDTTVVNVPTTDEELSLKAELDWLGSIDQFVSVSCSIRW